MTDLGVSLPLTRRFKKERRTRINHIVLPILLENRFTGFLISILEIAQFQIIEKLWIDSYILVIRHPFHLHRHPAAAAPISFLRSPANTPHYTYLRRFI